jgi:Fic-DOC domain mobile mystery protein B
MGLDFKLIHGQTPLDEEETNGLLIPTITTRGELDEFEQKNIEQAIKWTLMWKFKMNEMLTEDFVKLVHKKMYGQVWAWAGEFRTTNKNIGVDRFQISTELKKLLDDCKYWINNATFSPDETALRFKHRIVQIHCFSNGNGRHSRLMGDLIIEKIYGKPVFSWGANSDIAADNSTRQEYLSAVRAADAHNILPLLEFGRK